MLIAARAVYAFATGDLVLGQLGRIDLRCQVRRSRELRGDRLERIPALYDTRSMLAEPMRVWVGAMPSTATQTITVRRGG